MHTFDLRNMLDIRRFKIVFCLLFLMLGNAQAQLFSKWAKQHNPNYDNRFFSYGFQVSVHTTNYWVKYSDRFVTPKMDTVHSVVSQFRPGFIAGFLVNLRLGEFFDFRVTPQAGFYGLTLLYRYTNKATQSLLVESTLLEIPMLFKYKSERRGNVRMYMLGGVTPAFQLTGKYSASTSSALDIAKENFALNTGLGFDFYYPFFKLSVEARFSRGVANMLKSQNGAFAAPITSLYTNTFAVYFIFQ
ncbi:MAG: hypothetical protein CRN43_18605 [Candidatus Nephrothrix sp. EaCA]|nr:MAG: hypothetical protein CRN43_18605 [Candidatus Nephrothrix sp. EaCA]